MSQKPLKVVYVTPWNTFRELPENELAKRVDELVAKVTNPLRAIFNFHAPPYRSGLDEAPGLDENFNMKAAAEPCNRSARRPSERLLSGSSRCWAAWPYIHESRRAVRIGRTLALNPGSSYEEGVLQRALVTPDPKKPRIELRAGQRIGPAATGAAARTAREGGAA